MTGLKYSPSRFFAPDQFPHAVNFLKLWRKTKDRRDIIRKSIDMIRAPEEFCSSRNVCQKVAVKWR